MKLPHISASGLACVMMLGACHGPSERLMLDVHHLPAGEVALADVAAAHQKDLAVQDAHDVRYRRYWVDQGTGTIFCLVEAPTPEAASDVHREAHGFLADELREVVPGIRPATASGAPLFMDTHRMDSGVRAEDVAAAHLKDLAVEGRHSVRFLEYWVDERGGVVHCLAEAPDAQAVVAAHREAHGLLPESVQPVVEGP